nr:hypothetical protein [uncultured Flavobacterium sp.]
MTVGELKQWLEMNNVPDDMDIILIDTTTDDTDNMNYFISENDLDIQDVYPMDDDYPEGVEPGTPVGKAVMIYFENKLNENPIN